MSQTVYISPSSGPDLAAIINAALADPDVTTVILEPGLFLLHSSIIVPSGKKLMGSGREDTIIRAAADFIWPSVQQNAMIASENYSTNITISDLSVDADRVSPGGLRLNGILMRFTQDFLVERVDVSNTTGYANYAVGDLGAFFNGGPTGNPVSGRYEDVNTYNSQVHFEQYFADGITLFNVHARDGAGDISTEAYFHPIVGSRNITFEQVSAIGAGFLGFSLISSVLPLENIQIIDSQIEIMHPSTGSALISLGGLPVNGLFIDNSSFIAYNYIAFRIGGVTGTAVNSYFQGGVFAMEVTTSGDGSPSQFVVTDSDALGVRDATSGFGVAGVHSDQASYLSWTDGSIEARGGLNFPVSGAATLSPTTDLIGTGHDLILTYSEGSSDLKLFATKDFGLPGAPDLNGAVLRVEYLSHFAISDALALASTNPISMSGANVRYNGQTIGTISGGANGSDLQIVLNSDASPAMVEALLDNIYFRNNSDAPLTIARLLAAELTLVDGSHYDVTASLSVIDVDDAASAVHDTATVTESSLVAIDVLANETDIDQRLDQVAMIDGTAMLIGDTVTLASGARVTLQTDGQLLYDPNGAFNALTDALNGYGFHSATDHFSYTLSGGSAATVTVTINGETSDEDILSGDANANALTPALPWQTLMGLAGTDSLSDNGLVADLRGGADNDVYFVSNSETLVSEEAGEGADSVYSALASFTLPSNVENLFFTVTGARLYGYGNAQNNTTEGGALGDFLISYTGHDILRGFGGADVLNGGDGHDVLDGGTGNDVMIGGSGNDIFYVDSASDVVVEGGDPGYDTVFTSLTNYTLADWVENLNFSGVASYAGIGNAAGNQIMGSISDDALSGLSGNDRLIGFGGADLLDGGEGNDLLQGGIGFDQLTGGVGADQFRFDTALSASNVDTISDFEFGVDQIQLALAVFSALDLGSLPASAFFEGTAAQNGAHRIIYDAETGSLYYDPDGSGSSAQILFATLAPYTVLGSDSFVII